MSSRDWYRDFEPPPEEHPVDLEVQARLRDDPEYDGLRAQVLELGGMLTHLLEGEALDLWLRVEAAMNDRWSMAAGAYYNAGVNAGLAKRVVDDVLADAGVDARLHPAPAMRALAAALARIAQQLS